MAHDRLAALRGDPDWWSTAARADDVRAVLVAAGQVLCRTSEAGVEPVWLPLGEAEATLPDGAERYLLGSDDGALLVALRPMGSAAVGEAAAVPVAGEWRGLRDLAPLLGTEAAGFLLQAVALANWHDSHPCCARCGAATGVALAGYQRRCPACAAEHYPRTDPAVIMTVTDGADRVLLGRQARWPEGWFSTLAGFVEPGESAEAAVAREVAEEVGLTVAEVAYRDSQPWPFPSSLMLGFAAAVAGVGDDPRPDGEEIVEARWFTRESLLAAVEQGEVRLPPGLSIAPRLIEGWYGGRLPGGW